MTEPATEPVDLDGTASPITHTLAGVVDRHTVWITDITGAPLVKKRYGSTFTVVQAIKLTYARRATPDGADGAFELEHVALWGSRAKKNGSASELGQEDAWNRSDVRDGRLPDWIADLGESYRPAAPALGPHLPAAGDHGYEPRDTVMV